MKNLQVRVKTDITSEPVSAAEAKLYCKATGTTEDTVFSELITTARQLIEKYLGISVAEKTIHATWVQLPEDNELELPYGPVISVSKVYKIDDEGTEEELTLNTDYHIYGDQDAIVKIESFWSSGTAFSGSVRVEYTAGYGNTNTETLPSAIKTAIRKLVVKSYGLRGDDPGSVIMDNEIKSEIAPYRKYLWI